MKRKSVFVFVLLLTFVCNLSIGLLGGVIGGRYITRIDSNSIDKSQQDTPQEIKIVESEELFIDVVEKTQNAVVSIVITKDLPIYEDFYINPGNGRGDVFDYFFRQKERRQVGEEEKQIGAGSGFIVSEDGYIITNKHVVSDPDASYTIIFNDGEKLEAEALDRDDYLDIAILKVEKNDLPYIKMGDSDSLKVGQRTLAIGNSLGEFSNTVSTGIVSGLSRSITAGSGRGDYETLSGVIQTDASINPGNSGGPLLNLEGEVIGVNVAVAANAENIGFAIPINSVKSIVESVKENGKIIRPFLGIRYISITEELKERNNLEVDYGILILRGEIQGDLAVIPGSPADKAGLEEYDIVLEINGVKLDEETSLQREIQEFSIGDEVKLKVLSDGEEEEVKVVLEEAP